MAWRKVAAADPSASPQPATADGIPLLLVYGEDRWWAFEDRCSHANCSFTSDGEIDGLTAVCNCHGSEFDVRTGVVLCMPASRPIRTIPVREREGLLEVEL